MGNEQASETSISLTSQDRQDWFKVQDQGFCELWANKKTGKRFQAYPIPDSITKDKVQLEKYIFRKLHGSTLVSAEAIVSQDQAFLCSQPSSSFVLIENIVSRLRNFSKCFSFEQILYILASSSSGFNTLSSFFGPLEPNQDMVCFNDEGKVKVWLNQNLSKNEASVNAKAYDADLQKGEDYNVAQRRSKQCVEKLFRITEASAASPFPQEFKEEIKNFSTFFQISNFIEFYSQQKGIKVPEKVELKREIAAMASSRPIQNTLIYSPRPSIQLSNLESSRVKQVFQPVSSQKISFPPPFVVSQSRTLQAVPPTFTVGPPLQNHKILITYPCTQKVVREPVYLVPENQKIEVASITQAHKAQVKLQENAQIEQSQQFVAPAQQKPAVFTSVEQKLPQANEQISASVFRLQTKEQTLQNAQQEMKTIYTFNEQPRIFVNYSQHHEYAHEEVEQLGKEAHNQAQVEEEVIQSNWKNQPRSESVYSQIQSYVPPLRQPQEHKTIDEAKEEEYPSPKKQQNQINEWEERLNKFTNSQHIQQREEAFNISSRDVKEQAHPEEPESFKNLKVTEHREEYVNELADLQSHDIEKYIRMKYQSYINEQSEPIQASQKDNYREEREAKAISYSYEPQSEDYTSYYKPYEYKETVYASQEVREKENYPSDYRQEAKISYDNRVSIEQDFPQYSSLRKYSNDYKYEKNHALVNDEAYDYKQGSLKSKRASRNSQVIEEKYSKYVLNSQKPPKSPSFIKPLEEVSLILPQDESFTQNRSYIPAPIYQKFSQPSIISKQSERKGITYEKLRNLLWQD